MSERFFFAGVTFHTSKDVGGGGKSWREQGKRNRNRTRVPTCVRHVFPHVFRNMFRNTSGKTHRGETCIEKKTSSQSLSMRSSLFLPSRPLSQHISVAVPFTTKQGSQGNGAKGERRSHSGSPTCHRVYHLLPRRSATVTVWDNLLSPK